MPDIQPALSACRAQDILAMVVRFVPLERYLESVGANYPDGR